MIETILPTEEQERLKEIAQNFRRGVEEYLESQRKGGDCSPDKYLDPIRGCESCAGCGKTYENNK